MSLRIFGHQRLVNVLFEAGAARIARPQAIRFAHSILSPGAYVNNRVLPSYPEQWRVVLNAMTQQLARLRDNVDVVASVATGGIVHGVALARVFELPHVIVHKKEKNHGLRGRVDCDERVLEGARVLLVEDTASTFESSLEAMEPLRALGAMVTNTMMICSWNFPAFRRNIVGHRVHAFCVGEMVLNTAIERRSVDEKHVSIVRHWLEHPEDERWTRDGKWVLPTE